MELGCSLFRKQICIIKCIERQSLHDISIRTYRLTTLPMSANLFTWSVNRGENVHFEYNEVP